jgi:hypothetical protein
LKLTRRKYRDENDYWRICEFLRQVMVCNSLREKCWPVWWIG